MELKEFVERALVEIVEGVAAAATVVATKGGAVALREQDDRRCYDQKLGQIVEFDIALTSADSSGTKGGIGVFLGGFTMGGTGEKRSDVSSLTRVKFTVPLLLPGKMMPQRQQGATQTQTR